MDKLVVRIIQVTLCISSGFAYNRAYVPRSLENNIGNRKTLFTSQKGYNKIASHCYNLKIFSSSEPPEFERMESIGRRNRSYASLFVLLFVSATSQWSRQVIYYLCDFSDRADSFKHINLDLNFSPESYAFLASFAFTTVFTLFSLVSGTVVDKYNRTKVLGYSSLISSLGTFAQSLARDFAQLVGLRSLIGSGQAFVNPAAFTLIADLFPKEILGTVNGIYSGGIYLGGGIASLSIILNDQLGWRNTFAFIGLIGVISSLASFLVIKDPKFDIPEKQNVEIPKSISKSIESEVILEKGVQASRLSELISSVSDVFKPSEVKLLLLGATFRFCAGFTIGVWKAPFIFSKFPEFESQFASTNALIVAGVGFLSSLLGGYLSDALMKPSNPIRQLRARMLVPALGSLLAAPLFAGFLLSPNPETALLFLVGEYLVAECWYGPTLAALFSVVAMDRRGTAQGMFSVIAAIGNVAPILVGALTSGRLSAISFPLDGSLLWVVSGSYVLSGLIFFALSLLEVERNALLLNEIETRDR